MPPGSGTTSVSTGHCPRKAQGNKTKTTPSNFRREPPCRTPPSGFLSLCLSIPLWAGAAPASGVMMSVPDIANRLQSTMGGRSTPNE
eukprot:3936514-Rhodomonas_salina.4